tara:strand:- start:15766 stop:16497 length:732 start_codon:yes stop_codon:yes gene_type:complete
MTVLIAGGDSFTYGSELPSQEYTWANILAKRKGWNICNTARPAASNSAIRRNVMNAIHKFKDLDLYVLVMWTFPNRYEFKFTYDTGQKDSPWYSINPWTYNEQNFEEHFFNENEDVLQHQVKNRQRAETLGITDFAKSYIKNVAETEYWEIYTSWCEIVMLQNYLLKHNIKYRFMHVDNSIFQYNDLMDMTLKTLRSDIDDTMFTIKEGMFNWAKRSKQEFYTTHPKESAHIEWINMLYDSIR